MIDWATWGTILGSIAGILGGIRWLLSVYFKQQERLEKLKDSMLAQRISELDATVTHLKEAMQAMEKRMESVESVFNVAAKDLEENRAALGGLTSSLKSFVDESKSRLNALELQLARAKVIKHGADTYIFKGEKKKS